MVVDTFPTYDFESPLGIVVCLLLMGLFWLPGFLWASWLHRREGYHWTFRALAGFGWSMAVFTACTTPFLWFRLTMTGLLQCLVPVWIAYTLLGLWCGGRLGKRAEPLVDSTVPSPEPLTPMSSHGRAYLFRLFLYITICLFTANLGARAVAKSSWSEGEKINYAIALVFLFVVGVCWCIRGRWQLGVSLRFSNMDALPPSRWIHGLAIGFILLQAASATVFDRSDWDDCFYCALMLDYAEVEELNRQEPTHREGFSLDGHNRVLIWELWGGLLSKFSGLNPQAISHTLWPGLLALLAYAGYWQVLRECIPRRWVPLAMLGVCAFFFWGISSHHVMTNYLLVRLWQGKSVLTHLCVPLIVVAQLRFMQRPSLSGALLLLAGQVFALAASSSGIFLMPMLTSALCWAWMWSGATPMLKCLGWSFLAFWWWMLRFLWATLHEGPSSPFPWNRVTQALGESWRLFRTLPWRRGILVIGVCLAVLLPAVGYGLAIRSEVLEMKALHVDKQPWNWDTGFNRMASYVESGAWEIVWLLLLPVLGLLLPRPWGIYPVVFTVMMILTWANPLFCDPIAQHLTNYWTYFRIYWLLPVGIGIGLTLALLGRIYALAVTHEAESLPWLAVERLAVGLVVSWFLPAAYVWGTANLGFASGGRPHYLGRNLSKMPLGLKEAANFMLRDPDVQTSGVRVLCLDAVSNYLTPYDRRFRFVITRELYSISMADQAGRREEAVQRHWLSRLLQGHVPQDPDADSLPPHVVWPDYYHLIPYETLAAAQPLTKERVAGFLNDLQVKYAVTMVTSRNYLEPQLQKVGFELVGTFGPREHERSSGSFSDALANYFFGPALWPGYISPLGYDVWRRDVTPAGE